MKNNIITIYTNESCPYCKAVKDHFTKKEVEFKELLTNEHADSYNEVTRITGIPSVPTIVYKDEYFVAGRDFHNPKHLEDLIKNYVKPNVSMQKLLVEKIKTLNYSINMAFSRTDQILKQIEKNTKNEQNEQ
tara:strand:+ start:183 stop:578 length:396 start_codon:yes stop_codon:yes gene_type:complete